jgi:hypothetical protein
VDGDRVLSESGIHRLAGLVGVAADRTGSP